MGGPANKIGWGAKTKKKPKKDGLLKKKMGPPLLKKKKKGKISPSHGIWWGGRGPLKVLFLAGEVFFFVYGKKK